MAQLFKGTTITETVTVTSQTLHDLIELATIGQVTPGDIDGAVQFIFTQQGTAPNHSIYPFWFDNNPQDPMLRVFAKPWDIWVGVGPHRLEIPLQNAAATDLAFGTLVVAHPGASQFTIGSSPSLNALGFLQSSAASGAWAPVCYFGIGWGLWCSAVSGAYRAPTAGDLIHSRNVPAGCMMGTAPPLGSAASETFFGSLLDTARSGTTLSFSPLRLMIWGPRQKLGGW